MPADTHGVYRDGKLVEQRKTVSDPSPEGQDSALVGDEKVQKDFPSAQDPREAERNDERLTVEKDQEAERKQAASDREKADDEADKAADKADKK